MPLKPTGHKILVKPDAPKETTDSGLILMKDRHEPEMSGEVVAVGRGPASAHRIRAATIARCQRVLDEVADRVPASSLRHELHKELSRIAMDLVTIPGVQEGDQVCFPYTAGQRIEVDGEACLLMNEDDISAVWEPAA